MIGNGVCKCSFCEYSCFKDGRLVCPYSACRLAQHQIADIIRVLNTIYNKNC